MTPTQTVLCALDFSDGARRALIRAADLAERAHGALHLLHVRPIVRARLAEGPDPQTAFEARVRAFVAEALGTADAFDVLAPVCHEVAGAAPTDAILRIADEIGADLVVMGTHGRTGLGHLFLGSVAEETLRRARVPVLVVPERAERTAPGPGAPVLLGADFSTHTWPALQAAMALTRAYGAPLAVAHARDVPAETLVDAHAHGALQPATGLASREEAHHALDNLLEAVGVPAERYAVPGRPAEVLVDVADRAHAGLLVVGTHGRTGWDRLRLGSVAEAVVRRAPCPVLVVPSLRDRPAA